MRTTRTRRGGAALVAVAAAGSMAALAACGSGGTADDGTTTLTMTVWGGDVDRAAYGERIALVEAARPDIAIDLQVIPNDQYEQKVQTMIAGGDGPDIMQVAEGVNVYSSKGQVLPLDDYVEAAGLDLEERFGPVGTLYSYDGRVHAIPDRSGAMIVYYNKDLFDAAGVAYPDATWTWDDAQEAMAALTVPGEQWGYGGADWWAQWWSFAYQNGGRIVDDAGRPAVDAPEVVEALQWANDLVHEHHVVPTAAEYADLGPEMSGDPAFLAQKVAMNTTGFWAVAGLLDADFAWDVAPMWRGDEQAVSAFGSGLAISRDSAAPDLAFDAIEILTDAEAQQVVIDTAQDVPANLAVQRSEAFLTPAWASGREISMAAFGESAEFIFTAPLVPEWNELQAALDDNLGTFWNEGGDAAERLAVVQGILESALRSGR